MLNLIIYIFTIISTQLLGFVTLPLIAKNLSVEDFGYYNLILSIAGLAGGLTTAWIRNVAFRTYYDAKGLGNSRQFLITYIILQAATLISGLIIAFALSAVFRFQEHPTVLWLMVILFVASGDLYALLLNTLRAEEKSRAYSALENTLSVLRILIILLLVRLQILSPASIIIVYSLILIIGSGFAWYAIQPTLSTRGTSQQIDVRHILQLGIPAIPLSVGGWVISTSDRLAIEYFLGAHELGIYAANYMIAYRIVGGIVAALFMFLWPRLLKVYSSDPVQFPSALRSSTRLYILGTVGPTLAIIFFSDFWLQLLTDRRYASTAPIMPVIALATWLSGLITYVNRPMEIRKQYGKMSIATIIAAIINMLCLLVLTPRLGLLGACLSTLIAYLSSFTVFFVLTGSSQVQVDWRMLGFTFAFFALCAYGFSVLLSSPLGLIAFGILYTAYTLFMARREKGNHVI